MFVLSVIFQIGAVTLAEMKIYFVLKIERKGKNAEIE